VELGFGGWSLVALRRAVQGVVSEAVRLEEWS
jgi:hypothetical protein